MDSFKYNFEVIILKWSYLVLHNAISAGHFRPPVVIPGPTIPSVSCVLEIGLLFDGRELCANEYIYNISHIYCMALSVLKLIIINTHIILPMTFRCAYWEKQSYRIRAVILHYIAQGNNSNSKHHTIATAFTWNMSQVFWQCNHRCIFIFT